MTTPAHRSPGVDPLARRLADAARYGRHQQVAKLRHQLVEQTGYDAEALDAWLDTIERYRAARAVDR